jgi:hypothetical protein
VFGVFAMQRVVALRASRPKGEKGESEHRPVGGCVRRGKEAAKRRRGESEHRPVGGCEHRRMQVRALPGRRVRASRQRGGGGRASTARWAGACAAGCRVRAPPNAGASTARGRVRASRQRGEGGERAPPGGRVRAPPGGRVRAPLDAGCVRRWMQGACAAGCRVRAPLDAGCVRRWMQGAFVNDSTVTVAPVAFTCEDFVRNSMMDSAD